MASSRKGLEFVPWPSKTSYSKPHTQIIIYFIIIALILILNWCHESKIWYVQSPTTTCHPRLTVECSRSHTDRTVSQKKMGPFGLNKMGGCSGDWVSILPCFIRHCHFWGANMGTTENKSINVQLHIVSISFMWTIEAGAHAHKS